MKFLIFDAGPLISLALSGLLDILEKLKSEKKDIEFIITPQVKKEVIDRAMNIKKYKLEAVKISELLDKKVLKISTEFVDDKKLIKEMNNILNLAGKILSIRRENIRLIQEGEASCLAFSKLCEKENLIVIDERTTRLITESTEKLQNLMETKLHVKLKLNEKELEYFRNFKYIRSSELAIISFKKEFIKLKIDSETLDAILHNLKFHGTTISSKEIEEVKKSFDGPRRN